MRTAVGLSFGAIPQGGGVLFQVWSKTDQIELVVQGHRASIPGLRLRSDGLREVFLSGVGAGARYGYRIDGQGPFPDPASRFQPDGVHGLSEVIDPAFSWTDNGFTPCSWSEAVIYELHCGSFTVEGRFASAAERLPDLRQLGVTAIELMPLADCPGRRNWGYDGVSLYAPSRNYGRPEEMRAFVNCAHGLGLSVYLDVVYNHFGPDGAYHRLYHPGFYASRIRTPWGDGLNFDGDCSATARAFFIENALHWLEEYHIDGFRLDATHAIQDNSEVHFLAELASILHRRAAELGRSVRVIAEDARNLNILLESPQKGGYGLDAVWADDFHHQVRRALAGDRHGYYTDFSGSSSDIAHTLSNGWFYEGQISTHHKAPRGTPTGTLPRDRFIICIQNHDQIGNRARGERLNHQVPPENYRAASALLLLAPETPLLFMGQEWAADSPFLFFTDHNEQLGPLVSEGRRREFAPFPEFSSKGARAAIPDPQSEETYLRSKLHWDERRKPGHRAMLRWYQRLIALRRQIRRKPLHCTITQNEDLITLDWQDGRESFLVAVALNHGGVWKDVRTHGQILFTSEDRQFTADPPAPPVSRPDGTLVLTRAGCVALHSRKGETCQ